MIRTILKNLKPELAGQEVLLKGWVNTYRNKGKIAFLDLREATGVIQCVLVAADLDEVSQGIMADLKPEYVVELIGLLQKRPENQVKPGNFGWAELLVKKVSVINEAQTPPFIVDNEELSVAEELRLKYRYIDLRRERMAKNIRRRDEVITFFRDYMHRNNFIEIETPIMMKGTPEGSREYVVPSRLEKGKFYVLPQSPQQFKQLCMIAGFERYFQIARCFRDEDSRGDRQPEFTQLDFEMSFVDQEDIFQYTEKMFIELINTLYPHKKITQVPFPRITYKESMEKYGSDKPDIRKDKNDIDELGFIWVVDFPMFEKDEQGKISAAHHPFCSVNDEDVAKFMAGEDLLSIRAKSYDLVLNGYELSSGSIRIHKSDMQQKVFDILGISEQEQQVRFGHMLEAFKYGAPPHGGFAPGIDRIMMILENEPNIREVIAFPKTSDAKDLMMGAPSEVGPEQLKDLGIKLS